MFLQRINEVPKLGVKPPLIFETSLGTFTGEFKSTHMILISMSEGIVGV